MPQRCRGAQRVPSAIGTERVHERRREYLGTKPVTTDHPVTLVRATASNIAKLFDAVEYEVFDATIDTRRLRRFLADQQHLMIVAVQNRRLVGQARGVVHLSPDQPDELYIDNLGVTPACQRRGIGGRLVDELLDWGRELGCTYAWLGTELENEGPAPCTLGEAAVSRRS